MKKFALIQITGGNPANIDQQFPAELLGTDAIILTTGLMTKSNFKVVNELTEEQYKKAIAPKRQADFMPEGAQFQWDNIEIHPVCYINPEDGSDTFSTLCDEGEEDFYSVYLHDVNGGINCIADLPDAATAEKFADLLICAIKKYKDNGYLTQRGFIVLQNLTDSYQPIFREDDELKFYPTKTEAQGAINEAIKDIAEAIQEKNMSEDSRESEDDYKIVPAVLKGSKIYCNVDGEFYSMDKTDDDYKYDKEAKRFFI